MLQSYLQAGPSSFAAIKAVERAAWLTIVAAIVVGKPLTISAKTPTVERSTWIISCVASFKKLKLVTDNCVLQPGLLKVGLKMLVLVGRAD